MADKNILCAVDTTDEAHEVLRAAKQYRDREGAKVTVLTVVKPLVQAYGGLDLAVLGHNSIEFEREALASAQQHVEALAKSYSLEGDAKAVLGTPAHEIRSHATEMQADLIVMGSHGRHGLGRLLGSTANGVLHGLPCDVLIVRIQSEDK